MSLMQRVWTGLVIVVVVFLAARVSITLLSPHPVYVDDPAPCASVMVTRAARNTTTTITSPVQTRCMRLMPSPPGARMRPSRAAGNRR